MLEGRGGQGQIKEKLLRREKRARQNPKGFCMFVIKTNATHLAWIGNESKLIRHQHKKTSLHV